MGVLGRWHENLTLLAAYMHTEGLGSGAGCIICMLMTVWQELGNLQAAVVRL